ncbi:unnamed protein product [Urochloa decumbens]|uniref:FBD domain-containing protein n=1 Tax=Urochloa decumbens TaxID=240449 RepID=A0ABC9E3F7_9POAL
MDSTAAEDETRAAKRARLTPSAAGGDADLISGLDDGVLLHVLGLVPDASDAVRTGALSRRWLRLWTLVPALRFASRISTGADALERYAAFVNGVLAQRARSGRAIESLQPIMPACVDAAQGWIRNAFRYGVKSFVLDLRLPPNFSGEHGHHEILLDGGFPGPLTLETMRLVLGDAKLRLPSTVNFASLVDLSLERIEIAAGGAHLLGRLVSSASCPHLQKLRMSKLRLPSFNEEMQLGAEVLSELWVDDVSVRSLELRAPSLRVLHIDICCHELLRVSAPRLEELAFFQLGVPPSRLVVDGDLAHVQSLKLFLKAHRPSRYGETENDTSILLLKQCSSVTCLGVNLEGPKVCEKDVDMIKSSVPHLAHVTSLTVNVSDVFERHDFGVGVASLLTRFKNLRHLSLRLPFFDSLLYDMREELDLECEHLDYWTSHDISMAHLQVVELTGLTGTECELWFMKAVLTSARGLRKVAISFNSKCEQHEDKMNAFDSMLHEKGMRTSHREAFMLNTCMNL